MVYSIPQFVNINKPYASLYTKRLTKDINGIEIRQCLMKVNINNKLINKITKF